MTATAAPTAHASPSPTLIAYGLGTAATAAGLAYTVLDQALIGGLDAHLHEVYDAVGKHGQPGPLYAYLYAMGVLGLLSWWFNIRAVRRRSPHARRWGVITFGLAALPVLAPVAITEYGSMVIPFGLAAGPLVAWLLGLIGLLALSRRRH